MSDQPPAATTCTLNKSWLFKMAVFILVTLGFGLWATFDAFYLYPRRGLADASYKLKDLLSAAAATGQLSEAGLAFPDPKAAYAELRGREEELQRRAAASGPDARKAEWEFRKLEWLGALSRAWRLDATPKPLGDLKATKDASAASLFFDPAKGAGYAVSGGTRKDLSPTELSTALGSYWNKAAVPSALSTYDMPVQFLFMAVGVGWAAYLVSLVLRCQARARGFAWEPGSMRLTVPGGASFTPADLEDMDKRLWHKYYVTMVLKDGSRHKLDLLRYVPLEDWVLEMERTRFPERAAEAAAADAGPLAPGAEPAGAEPEQPTRA